MPYHTYSGQKPKRVFRLAPHHYLVPTGTEVPGLAVEETDYSFKILTSPDGLAVARRHGDLKENEISLVLR